MERSPGNTDDDQDNSEGATDNDENQDDGGRPIKRVRGMKGPKFDSFRPKKKNGEILYEIWLMVFVNTLTPNRDFGDWCQITERFVSSDIVKEFVRQEVEAGRIGIELPDTPVS